jgi:cyclopropane-fatty-acyl-phospholipid synthase
MKSTSPERLVPEIFASADVTVNGSRPWDIQVHHPHFYKRLAAGGSMALGESYMDGWWDCDALDQFFDRILRFRLDRQAKKTLKTLWCSVKAACTCSPGRFRAFDIGRRHYDIGNDLFSLMLDKWMNYSCAYWKDAGDLDAAQESKMDLICRKLKLRPGMRVLDVGCGWGGLAAYFAKHYDVEVVGITVSREQAKLARQRCEGLPVTIKLEDYRRLTGTFDRIVSVGMLEHVGDRPLSHLHAHDPPLPGTRGAFSAAHHRRQPIRAFLRPLDFQIHLPKFHAAIQPADLIGI